MRLSDRLWDWRERCQSWLEKTWLCTIRRQHHVKMQSYGHCYRCGKLITTD